VADKFISEMRTKTKKKSKIRKEDVAEAIERKDSTSRKSVKFAMDRSVHFRDEREEIE